MPGSDLIVWIGLLLGWFTLGIALSTAFVAALHGAAVAVVLCPASGTSPRAAAGSGLPLFGVLALVALLGCI